MTGTVFVTGAAGFIGSHVAEALLESGVRVLGLDNFHPYYDVALKHSNLRDITDTSERRGIDFTFVEGDIRNRELVRDLFSQHRPQAVVHLAAMPGVGPSVSDPWLYYDINLTGTLNLLDATREYGRPNFVFASTSSAYGDTRRIPFTEDDPADHPLAPYPASKRSAELLGYSYHRLHGLDFCAIRFFTVYGPRGRPDMLAFRALENIFHQKPLALFRGGQLMRDWTYVADIVAGILSATKVRLGYEVVNIGRGEPVSVQEFVELLEQHSGKKATVTDGPMPDSDMAVTFASIEKARSLFGYQPTTNVSEGTARFVKWYRERVL